MSKEPPFTPKERATLVRWAQEALAPESEKWFVGGFFGASRTLRWDATLRRLEKALAAATQELSAVTKERDKYHYVADTWIGDFSSGQDALADAAQEQWDRQGFIS